ncbi:MAG TPA: D-aminoacyl-tRNA deacylase [Fimbriimonas sp.]|nr:D-aminoacyl-tRNA deacylase [Fimbriimonas sp.]
MRAVVQRVLEASVSVDGQVIGKCDQGLMILVGVSKVDQAKDAQSMARKIAKLRIFNDPEGKMNLSMSQLDSPAQALVVSNFTLYGDVKGQNRPSFMDSAGFEAGKSLYEEFLKELEAQGVQVQTGEYGADMQVALVNDGPVTLVIDSERL